MTKLRWGIIGPGRIAYRLAESLPAANRSVLQAVHSSNESRAAEFAAKYNSRSHTTDLDAFLADDQIDVVYIAKPHNFHYDSIIQVLNAGKPVLCEKPLTVTATQTQTVIDLAKEKNLFLMEALWSRFLPVWQQVRRWIDDGYLGDVQFMKSSFGFPIPRDVDDRLLSKSLAGGVLLDMGVYNIALSQFVMQQYPTDFQADVLVGDTGVDERTSVLLKYGDIVSQFTASFSTLHENGFSIHGTKANIYVEPLFWDTTKAVLKPYDGEEVVFEKPFKQNGFEYQVMEVERCLENGWLESPIISWADTLNTQQTMDAILATGGVVYDV